MKVFIILIPVLSSFNLNDQYFHQVRYEGDPDFTDNFGYSIAFYKKGIIVGSPNAYRNSGHAYNCSYNVYPAQKNHEGQFKCNAVRNLPSIPDQLLGASVDILPSGATLICAPGYSVENQTISSGKTKYNPGRCFHKANFYTRKWTEVMPCSNYKFEMSFNGGGRSQCTSGIASKLLDDDNMLVSAPGADYRVFVKKITVIFRRAVTSVDRK